MIFIFFYYIYIFFNSTRSNIHKCRQMSRLVREKRKPTSADAAGRYRAGILY